ncbi:MAG: carbohydrate-binding protein, partial [Gemmatimonadaceae bacterium]|nr:carbohydrate-binding protein [Acetobacteraceae bacterium]
VTGLPRSNGDHLTNSLEFRANPAAGQAGEPSHLLYVTQGSNSAMGRPDDAWGQRGERLLNAAILEIDPTRTAPTGGFNVQTEPTPAGNTVNPPSTFNADGTVNGFYNPFATDAVVRLFATGTRNAYDLVWHSNGFLYVPTNGSAAGGNTPDNPATPQNEALTNASLQSDYLFRVQDGGYYGHPNALRDEFILNGGNPTAGVDRNEVLPSSGRAGYAAGVAPDPNYRAESAYSLGFNRSPNGATEYKSAVFGTKLKGAVLFTEYSGGNDVRAVLLDANGFVTQDFVLKNASGATIQYTDPLDIIENPATGQLYLLTLNRSNGESQIVRLDPTPGGTVTPPPPPTGERVLLRTVQAEDNTPGDGTAVTIAAPPAGQIVIRTTANPETSGSPALVGGLRPGAFGLDGNTVNTDGVAGGYADFGATNADFLTFTINLTAAEAGAAVLAFRYANGNDPAAAEGGARPLAVLVNGVQVGIPAFAPGAGATTDARLANWLVVEVPATLIAGANTITLQATANIGPNVDQLEVFRIGTPTPPPTTGLYEAELAARTPGAIVDTIHAGFTGTGFVDYVAGAAGDPNPKLTFSVQVATAGSYEVRIRYSNRTASGPRPLGLEVNGAAQGTLPFVPVGDLDTNYGIQTATLQLQAGTNTIGLTAPGGVGPNIDSLFVPAAPSAPPFVPTYAVIPATEAGGKIELETGTTARVVNDSAVEFYFTVAADGLYALDLAATVDAEDGVGLTLLLNGTEVARADYPQGGEETVYLDLRAGVNYQLRANSAQTGASGLDYLEVRRAPGDVNADIAVQSLDPAYFDNRLHFSFIENPDFNNDDGTPGADRVFKDSAQVRISNTGTSPLSVLDSTLSGPFKLATPGQLDGLVLQAGQSVTVTVLFDRAAYTPPTTNADATSTVFTGGLRLLTNDAENPSTTIDLAGFWQNVDEGGQEPNVNEVWQVFGFGNVIEGLSTRGGGENSVLDRADRYESSDVTEVLSPYWRLADGVAAATITHLAAFHGPGGATVGIHGPGNSGGSNQVQFWNHTGEDNQRLLPRSGTGFATRTFNNATIPDVWAGNEMFGIEIAGLSTDPRLNPVGPVVVPGVQQGYTMRMFQAVDLRGAAIANTFLGIMDYTGINYDYNDNVILIEGVTPVGTGAEIDVTNRDGVPSDKRLVMSRIDNPANATQVVHDTATIRITNPGAAALEITSLTVADPAAFQLVGAPTATTIAAGAFLDVTVRFIGSDQLNDDAAVAFESQLVILSNDFDEGRTVIELAGLAQFQSEGGEEPKVQQIVDAFGFGTDVAEAEINKGGLVEANGDEILSPYFIRANSAAPITITQLAAYHGQGDVARLYVHDLDSRQLTQIIAHDEQDGQTLLPRTLNGGAALATASLNRNDPFGFFAEIVGRQGFLSWSDPDANLYEDSIDAVGARGANLGWDSGDGHLIRVYIAKDAAGVVIPDTLLVVQDYAGVNYDYNDNIFLVRNVRSYNPAGVEDADRNGRVDIYDDADGDGTPNFAEPPPQSAFGGTPRVIGAGPAPVTLNATVFDVGGQGVAYNDLTPQDEGGTQGRNEGPDVLGNNTAIGFVAPGEWLEYTVNVAVAGTYTLNVNAASPDPGRTVSASFALGGTVYATAPNAVVVDTNNYTSFTPSAPVSVNLQAGEQVVRLTFGVGSFDIQSFTLDRANFAPVVAVPLTAQSGQQGQAFSYTLPAGTFTDADNEALSYTATGLPGGLTISAAGVISGTPTVSGTFTATVRASDGTVSTPTTLALTLAAAPPPPIPVQTPFGGTARMIGAGPAPVTLNATVFDVGGQGVAFNDLTPQDEGGSLGRNEGPDVLGNNLGVGWIAPGEWLEYTVNVAQAGAYTFTVNAASPDPGRTVSASFAQGGTVYATAPNAGVVDTNNYTSFTASAPVSVNLRGGEQVVRLTFGTGSFDLQSFTLDRANFAPVAAVPLPAATGQQGQAFSYTLPAGTFTDADNEALSYSATGLPGGLTISAAGVISGTPTTSGTFTTVVRASDGQASTTTNLALTLTAAPPPPIPVQTPFGGTARVIGAGPAPVTLNATVFDVGGQGVAFNDLTPQDEGGSLGRNEGVDVLGNNLGVGWIAPGEWLEYTVNVAQAGAYTFRANAASPDPGRTVSASFAQAGAVYA